MLLAIKKAIRAAERKFYERLHEMRQERESPVNYRSIELSAKALRYVDLSNRVYLVPFENIVKIEFVREEALFPCLDGPYLETKWRVSLFRSTQIDVMDEMPHRKQLIAAFSSHVPGFDLSAVAEGLGSNVAGKWLCYQASNTESGDA